MDDQTNMRSVTAYHWRGVGGHRWFGGTGECDVPRLMVGIVWFATIRSQQYSTHLIRTQCNMSKHVQDFNLHSKERDRGDHFHKSTILSLSSCHRTLNSGTAKLQTFSSSILRSMHSLMIASTITSSAAFCENRNCRTSTPILQASQPRELEICCSPIATFPQRNSSDVRSGRGTPAEGSGAARKASRNARKAERSMAPDSYTAGN